MQISSAAQKPESKERLGSLARRLFTYGVLFVLIFLISGFVRFSLRLNEFANPSETFGDGIVVLTGGKSRVETALELLSQNNANQLLISGTNPTTGLKALSVRYPDYENLIECCVALDSASLDTRQNAIATAKWVEAADIRQLIVVTSDYHMQRALIELGRAIPEINLVPHAVTTNNTADFGWLSDTNRLPLILSEYFKTLAASANLVSFLSNKNNISVAKP